MRPIPAQLCTAEPVGVRGTPFLLAGVFPASVMHSTLSVALEALALSSFPPCCFHCHAFGCLLSDKAECGKWMQRTEFRVIATDYYTTRSQGSSVVEQRTHKPL